MGISRSFGFEQVEGLRVGRFDLGLNTSAVLYHLGSTIIDTGPPNRWSCVREFIRGRNVRQVLLTHHHEDHSGNAARIRRVTGARVLAHPLALSPLAKGWFLAPYQRLFWGRPEPFDADPAPDEIDLDEEGKLRAIHTPGHADDQVCYLHEERGWLFTGDLFIASRPRYLRFDEDIKRQIASLRAVLTHDFQLVFCGHRGVVSDGFQAFREKLDYLEDLCGRAGDLQQAGWPARRIARHLLGREDLTSLATGYTFTKGNLIRACLDAGRIGS
jgi:glyoxylase-like metal-dependent hydrolase (beta-lactamase superfamily II)